MLYSITVKQNKYANGIRVEKGMTVEVVTSTLTDPLLTNGGQAIADAFARIYGVDIKRAGALNRVYLDVKAMK